MLKLRRIGVFGWLQVLLLALLGWAATVLVEHYDRQAADAARLGQVEAQLQVGAARLEKQLNGLLRINHELAADIAADYETRPEQLQRLTGQRMAGQNRIASVTLARGLEVIFVHPFIGNEAVLGMNYGTRPDVMAGVSRAIARRDTVVTGPLRLVQNGRVGLVGRTPIFLPPVDGKPGEYWGLVSTAVDLEGLLEDAGLVSPKLPFVLAMRGREGSGARGEPFYGDYALFKQTHVAVDVNVPGGQWRLVAAPRAEAGQDELRRWLIRGVGAAATLAGVLMLLIRWRRPEPAVAVGADLADVEDARVAAQAAAPGGMSLRAFLMSALMLVLLPIVGISGWISYHNAEQASGQFTEALAAEVGERVHDRVAAFFEVPRRVVAYNVEMARAGLLGHERRDEMMQRFLLQIRQQPLLTFVSIGMADGEYYAGSRPPLGEDRGLRMLQSRHADELVMQMFRVDDAARAATLVSRGKGRFDARERPWFRAAASASGIAWYPAYRYAIHDEERAYETMGIGMSAPLHDRDGQFIGVTTADVALSQLSEFLAELTAHTGGAAFIAESGGELLGTSTAQPLYVLEEGRVRRLGLADHANPLIRAAGEAIARAAQPEGSAETQAAGVPYQVDWRSHELAQGPRLIVGVILPRAGFDAVTSGMLRNIVYLALAVTLFSFVIGLFATDWVARPLASLSQSAVRMARGDWQAALPQPGPIREVASLFAAMNAMSRQLQRYTENLEQLVAQRTEALEEANRKLAALSITDGLTGVANRRRMDEVLTQEWSRARRKNQELAVLMIDVDFFKRYNDHYGHQAGDECLVQVARTLQAGARRGSDLVARYGGEEFVVIVAESDLQQAVQLGHKLCEAVAALELPHAESPQGRITISVGVAARLATADTQPESLLRLADQALYRAKEGGRNRVMA